MVSRETLESYTVGELRKEVSKTNLKGVSKLKKSELIDAMLAVKDNRFDYLEKKVKQPRQPRIKEVKKEEKKEEKKPEKKETKKVEKVEEKKERKKPVRKEDDFELKSDDVTARGTVIRIMKQQLDLLEKMQNVVKNKTGLKRKFKRFKELLGQVMSRKALEEENYNDRAKRAILKELKTIYPTFNKEIKKINRLMKQNPEALPAGEEKFQFPQL